MFNFMNGTINPCDRDGSVFCSRNMYRVKCVYLWRYCRCADSIILLSTVMELCVSIKIHIYRYFHVETYAGHCTRCSCARLDNAYTVAAGNSTA